jgi:hypothetical protein
MFTLQKHRERLIRVRGEKLCDNGLDFRASLEGAASVRVHTQLVRYVVTFINVISEARKYFIP